MKERRAKLGDAKTSEEKPQLTFEGVTELDMTEEKLDSSVKRHETR